MSKALPAPRCVDHRPCAYYGTFAAAVELRGRGESVQGWPRSNRVANVAIELPMLPWLNHGEDLAEHRSDLHKVGPVPRDPTEVRPSSFDFMSLSMPILTSWVYGISLSMVSICFYGYGGLESKAASFVHRGGNMPFLPQGVVRLTEQLLPGMPGTGIGISWNHSPTTKTKLWAAPKGSWWNLKHGIEHRKYLKILPSWNIMKYLDSAKCQQSVALSTRP